MSISGPDNGLNYDPIPVLDVFVPDEGDKVEIAVLLCGTADEYNISQRHIRADAARGGYWISSELADIVYDGADQDPETSGDAAGDNSTTEQE